MRLQSRLSIECDVPEGIEFVAMDEVRERLPGAERIGSAPGKIWFELPASHLREVGSLRTASGAWIVDSYEGRKPSVLLGDRRLAERIRTVVQLDRRIDAFAFSAPGAGSPAMRAIRASLERDTGLRESDEGLLVRLRRRRGGWDVLVATGRRPLAERPWRVVRTRGALNGPLAAAVVRLTRPAPDDRFLNVASGSGTIAIERRLYGPASFVVAVDIDRDAMRGAAANVRASRVCVHLATTDARRLPFPSGAFDVVCADLPWGYEVGSHDGNVLDYAALLGELGRVARRRARACILSAETRHMQRVLGELAGLWRLDSLVRVEQGGAHPGLFVLRRA